MCRSRCRALKDAARYISLKKTNEIVEKAYEDIMEKIDLSVVFEYQHVFEHVGRLPEFKRMYIERREVLVCAWSER